MAYISLWYVHVPRSVLVCLELNRPKYVHVPRSGQGSVWYMRICTYQGLFRGKCTYLGLFWSVWYVHIPIHGYLSILT